MGFGVIKGLKVRGEKSLPSEKNHWGDKEGGNRDDSKGKTFIPRGPFLTQRGNGKEREAWTLARMQKKKKTAPSPEGSLSKKCERRKRIRGTALGKKDHRLFGGPL